jgi:hypothetical protein
MLRVKHSNWRVCSAAVIYPGGMLLCAVRRLSNRALQTAKTATATAANPTVLTNRESQGTKLILVDIKIVSICFYLLAWGGNSGHTGQKRPILYY